jgi:hypothetical protein
LLRLRILLAGEAFFCGKQLAMPLGAQGGTHAQLLTNRRCNLITSRTSSCDVGPARSLLALLHHGAARNQSIKNNQTKFNAGGTEHIQTSPIASHLLPGICPAWDTRWMRVNHREVRFTPKKSSSLRRAKFACGTRPASPSLREC